MERIPNGNIRQDLKIFNLEEKMKEYNIDWYGYLDRMRTDKLPGLALKYHSDHRSIATRWED